MKKILVLLLVLISLSSNAQLNYGLQGLLPNDSNNFEYTGLKINIDTTNVNNDWTIGSTMKPFFGQANSFPNAIMTDSLNPYSSNNLSYFDVGVNQNTFSGYGFPYNLYFQFDHKYETDSLIDGGYITLSYDSGQTLVNVINDSTCIMCWPNINSENLYTTNDTLVNGEYGFSGTSDWKTSTFQWVWVLPVKYMASDSLIIRFNFVSDNVQTNKDGWIIDNIVVGGIDLGSSVEEIQNSIKVIFYPTITADYFNYKIENDEKIESIVVVDISGKQILTIAQPKNEDRIDVSNYPSGNYYVKFSSKEKQVIKKLIIN